MKKLDKKGFTLIELLAVIVILAVVLGIAIPAVSQYITKSKKNGYKDNLIQFIDAARKGAALGEEYSFPVDQNDATVIPFKVLSIALEKGGKKSSYDEEWKMLGSYVVIVNTGNADSPSYDYFVTASDGKYVTGESGTKKIFNENALEGAKVIRLDSSDDSTPSKGSCFSLNDDTLTVDTSCSSSSGTRITIKEVAGSTSTTGE